MTPSGVHVNKPLIAIVAGVLVLATVGYKYSGHILGTVEKSELQTKSGLETVNEVEEKPKRVMSDNSKVVDGVQEGDLKINVDSTPATVHYRLAEPNVCKLDVLFLHGAAFSSNTWFERMQSLQVLSKLGYKVVAIDLPGFGQSPSANVDPSRYLEEVIKGLQLNKPVIISPSMSGGFSLPYLFKDPVNVLTRARGYVPVAPVGTEKYTSEQYHALKIPTLIICGDKDKGIGKTSVERLKHIPGSELKMYENSGHPAYLDRPEDFHKDLDHFFTKILDTKT